jgi:radical SAM protein with 4Fe4S-binding SPASM domain
MARTVMSPEVFERTLQQLEAQPATFKVVSLYQGGEPFLNRNFLTMASRVKATGVPLVKTVSNGMLIRPEMCDDIVRCGLDLIEISLDGDSPEQSNQVRVRSRFEHIAMIVHKLVEAKHRISSEIDICISNTQFRDRKSFDLDIEFPAPAEYLLAAFADIKDDVVFNPNWAKLWPSGQPASGYDLLLDDRARERPRNCSLLDDMLNIRADGSVVACCYDLTSMTNFGNIMEQSLEEIWNGSISREFRQNFAAGAYPQLCQKCVVVTGDMFLLDKQRNSLQKTYGASELLSERKKSA